MKLQYEGDRFTRGIAHSFRVSLVVYRIGFGRSLSMSSISNAGFVEEE